MREMLTILAVFALASGLSAEAPRLSASSIGPQDDPSVLLSLSKAERVSIRAISSIGVPISLHDKMEGRIAQAGSAGEMDGRVDLSLDKGEYRVRLEARDEGGKVVRLEARSFREIGGEAPSAWPRLVPGAVATASLKDLESASYWIELREDGAIEVEALGRSLGAMELWREGQYLIQAFSPQEERQVVSGRPMGWACASLKAKAGLYLVRLYGRPARAWAKGDDSSPLYVRSGFIGMPAGGRLDLQVSPFGRDFVLVEGADRAQLGLAKPGSASLASAQYSPGKDRLSAEDRAAIDKKSTVPSCSVSLAGGASLVRLEASPGEAVSLDAFRGLSAGSITAADMRAGGLLTLLSPRSSSPELEVTGFAFRIPEGKAEQRAAIVEDFCAPLSAAASVRRSCNLGSGGERSMYLRVEESGDYLVAEKAGAGQAEAEYSLQSLGPILQPAGVSPQRKGAKSAAFSLIKGYYLLRISPKGLGVLDFALYKDGFGKAAKSELAKDPPAPRGSISRSFAADPAAQELRLLAARGPSGGAGYRFERYPLRLDAGLGIELGPKESLGIPAYFAQRGTFRWDSRQGKVLLGGQAPVDGGLLPAGVVALSLRNDSAAAVRPAFSAAAAYDDLPAPAASGFGEGVARLAPARAEWRDFARSDSALYCFEVEEAAVYVVETLGRLSTSLSIRTASRLGLFQAEANGYGRNAAIRAWLRPGQYYVEAATEGRSAGRGGIRLGRVPLAATTALEDGAVDRRAVPADSAARFSVALDRPADLELRSTGLAGAYQVLLEDESGFLAYKGEGRARLRLGAGHYRLYSLPVSIDTNRLTWVREIRSGPAAAPLPGTVGLALNSSASATWLGGASADRYSFEVPAALDARLELPESFEAVLDGPGGKRSLAPSDHASIALERGLYSLSVRPREAASQLSYSIGLGTQVLAPGVQGVSVSSLPASVRLSVPEDGFYELWSLGRRDVSARLFRGDSSGPAKGEQVDQSDDNGPDWNFDIVRKLKAGSYRLEVNSLAGSDEAVELHLTSRNAKPLPASAAPFEARVPMDESGVLLAFDAKQGEGLYLVSAKGSATDEAPVSLRLYRGDDLLAAGEGGIAVPLGGAARYSLYAWAPFVASPQLSIRRLPEKEASIAEAFSLEAGGVARLRNAQALSAVASSGRLLVSPGLELPCRDPGSAPFSTTEAGGWAWAPDAAASALPLVLGEGEGAVLALGETGQGFSMASGEEAILVSVDTRGQFRCGVSASPASGVGAAPFDWDASATWSQGVVALLPPGSWKARVWDGERSTPGAASRRVGAGLDRYEVHAQPALAMGARGTLSVPAGKALSMEVPTCTLSILMGKGLVLSAWKDGDAIATRASLDGREADTLALKASRMLVANRGASDASLRFAVLPPRSQSEDELTAARPFESIGLPPEGVRLSLRASAGELLCLAGDPFEVELEAADGSYAKLSRSASSGLFDSMPARSGSLRIRSAGGLARVYLARPGKELDGLLAQEGAASPRELKDAALLSGKGDAFRVKLEASGYVDFSCPGPGVMSLSGAGIERRAAVSGSREDMHLFAWLPAGEYALWQRPARGAASGGILRMDKVESREAGAQGSASASFIGAGEYQAWSFAVAARGKVGVGLRAESDGLQGGLYDSRQGLVARGPLVFAELEPGSYLFVVRGLDSGPMEYSLELAGLDGSRQGVPPEVADKYKAEGGAPASIAVPMRARGASASSRGGDGRAIDEAATSGDDEGELESDEDGGAYSEGEEGSEGESEVESEGENNDE